VYIMYGLLSDYWDWNGVGDGKGRDRNWEGSLRGENEDWGGVEI